MTPTTKPARKKLGSAFGDDGLVPAERHRDTRGDLLVSARIKLETRREFIEEIGRLWKRANDAFLDVGRHLIEAKARLEHGEFGEMVERDMPFSHRTANMLMKVAEAVDTGALPFPADQLPPSYATVYEVVTLKPEEQQQAVAAGLVNPTVRREDVVAFRRQLRVRERQPGSSPSRKALEKELAKLEAEERRIRERRAEIEHMLSTVGD